MECVDVMGVLEVVNTIRKDWKPDQRPDVGRVCEAIRHLGFRHSDSNKKVCSGCDLCKGCEACIKSFSERVCRGSASWFPQNLDSQRTLAHYVIHRRTRVPQCMKDPKALFELSQDLRAALKKIKLEQLGIPVSEAS